MNTENYKSVKIKTNTYKNIKQLALDMDMSVIKLIELMYQRFITDLK